MEETLIDETVMEEVLPDTRFLCGDCQTSYLGSLFDALLQSETWPRCCGRPMAVERTMIPVDRFLQSIASRLQRSVIEKPRQQQSKFPVG